MTILRSHVPHQTSLRAITRAQESPLHDDIKRMEILGVLLQSVLSIGLDLPRSIMLADKGTGFMGFKSLIDEVGENLAIHTYGKASARLNAATLAKLDLIFETMESHLDDGRLFYPDRRIALAKSVIHAARDFYAATKEEGVCLKAAWAAKGILARQNPFTAFTITNEVMMHVIPKLDKAYPKIIEHAWPNGWGNHRTLEQRVISLRNCVFGTARAGNVDFICRGLSRMYNDIALLRVSFTPSQHHDAKENLNYRVLEALETYTLPYANRSGSLAPLPDSAPNNMYKMEDFRHARSGAAPFRPRPL